MMTPIAMNDFHIDLGSDNALAVARQENEAAIRRLLTCRQKGMWPTGYEGTRVLDVS